MTMYDGPFEIPDVPDDRIRELAERVLPLVKRDGKLQHIEVDSTQLWNVSYPWIENATLHEPDGLEEVARITTLHKYGYYGFFKPSVAEVLSQLPEEYQDQEGLFFFVDGPDTVDDLNAEKPALDAGFHVAETTIYKGLERATWHERLGEI